MFAGKSASVAPVRGAGSTARPTRRAARRSDERACAGVAARSRRCAVRMHERAGLGARSHLRPSRPRVHDLNGLPTDLERAHCIQGVMASAVSRVGAGQTVTVRFEPGASRAGARARARARPRTSRRACGRDSIRAQRESSRAPARRRQRSPPGGMPSASSIARPAACSSRASTTAWPSPSAASTFRAVGRRVTSCTRSASSVCRAARRAG